MQYNDLLYSTKSIIVHLAKKGFENTKLMEQLPESSDINPTEILRYITKRDLSENRKPYLSKEDFWKAQETTSVRFETVTNLTKSLGNGRIKFLNVKKFILTCKIVKL